jgi:hypothetical protein
VAQIRSNLISSFAQFPRTRDYIYLTKDGIINRVSPDFAPAVGKDLGWSAFLAVDGTTFTGNRQASLR